MSSHSLLVPCYNAVRYIDSFLEQIDKLSVKFDEILFYDDASTDGTFDALQNKGLKVIKGTKNMGPGFARNRLAAEAEKNYIHFHDIDDEMAPNFLQLINEKLALAESDVILGYADWIDFHTRKSLILWKYNQQELLKDPLSYFIKHPLGIINTVYKKSTFLSIGGFNEEIKCWEDADLHVRFAAANASFQVIDSTIAWSLRHNDGISNDQQMCWICRLDFLENYLNNYSHLVDTTVFEQELKKVQTVFINMGLYTHLNKIFYLIKKHKLNLQYAKAMFIYYINKILPSFLLKKMIACLKPK
jgi:glycosyltransferase involved in cell wall biosynthesis